MVDSVYSPWLVVALVNSFDGGQVGFNVKGLLQGLLKLTTRWVSNRCMD